VAVVTEEMTKIAYDDLRADYLRRHNQATEYVLALHMIATSEFHTDETVRGLAWCQNLARETIK
jgi:hypothetical protein